MKKYLCGQIEQGAEPMVIEYENHQMDCKHFQVFYPDQQCNLRDEARPSARIGTLCSKMMAKNSFYLPEFIKTHSSGVVEAIVVGALGVHSQTSGFNRPDLTLFSAWNF